MRNYTLPCDSNRALYESFFRLWILAWLFLNEKIFIFAIIFLFLLSFSFFLLQSTHSIFCYCDLEERKNNNREELRRCPNKEKAWHIIGDSTTVNINFFYRHVEKFPQSIICGKNVLLHFKTFFYDHTKFFNLWHYASFIRWAR